MTSYPPVVISVLNSRGTTPDFGLDSERFLSGLILGIFSKKSLSSSYLSPMRLSLKMLWVEGFAGFPSRSSVSYLLKSSLEMSRKSTFFRYTLGDLLSGFFAGEAKWVIFGKHSGAGCFVVFCPDLELLERNLGVCGCRVGVCPEIL